MEINPYQDFTTNSGSLRTFAAFGIFTGGEGSARLCLWVFDIWGTLGDGVRNEYEGAVLL
jgi:hypothetical protein